MKTCTESRDAGAAPPPGQSLPRTRPTLVDEAVSWALGDVPWEVHDGVYLVAVAERDVRRTVANLSDVGLEIVTTGTGVVSARLPGDPSDQVWGMRVLDCDDEVFADPMVARAGTRLDAVRAAADAYLGSRGVFGWPVKVVAWAEHDGRPSGVLHRVELDMKPSFAIAVVP